MDCFCFSRCSPRMGLYWRWVFDGEVDTHGAESFFSFSSVCYFEYVRKLTLLYSSHRRVHRG